MTSVGFIGLGLMGRPMAANVLKAGFPLTVWNRTAIRAQELVASGARVARTPREAAASADVLFTIVSDPPALESVLWGADGALAGLRAGSVLVDSSTVSPALARRISAACAERGAECLDAPVTGGTWGAELALEVGALAEALALVQGAGIPGQRLVEVMQASMARAPVLDVKAPLILERKYAPSFPLRLMHKDLGLALDLANQLGVALPATAAAREIYSAVRGAAKEDLDYAAVAKFWQKD